MYCVHTETRPAAFAKQMMGKRRVDGLLACTAAAGAKVCFAGPKVPT